jgi:DNA-directed RNA polymerase sigma subunit (sigma70/sigma32)
MTTPLHGVTLAVRQVKRAEIERDFQIRNAFDPALRQRHGYTVEDIAKAADLTRERIYQIVKETR